MTSYASAADVPWNKYRDKIDTLLIEQGVTTLSPYAFSACAILEVAIPNSVTSLGVSCFAECPRLIRVTLPESISQIPERCFHECTEMKRINIPGHVTRIGQSAFFSCNSLKEANYMGTRWEWDKNVSVKNENGPLLQALKTLDEDMKSIGKCGDDMEAFISELLFRKPDHFENYDDWPFLWGQNEGTIAGNTQYVIFGSSLKNIVAPK